MFGVALPEKIRDGVANFIFKECCRAGPFFISQQVQNCGQFLVTAANAIFIEYLFKTWTLIGHTQEAKIDKCKDQGCKNPGWVNVSEKDHGNTCRKRKPQRELRMPFSTVKIDSQENNNVEEDPEKWFIDHGDKLYVESFCEAKVVEWQTLVRANADAAINSPNMAEIKSATVILIGRFL
jgi:hypothetical protein